MIRGVLGVVPCDKAEVGRFYMWADYGNGNWLFQCVAVADGQNGEAAPMALLLTLGGLPQLKLTEMPNRGSLVALYDIHIRVDPTSLDTESEIMPSRLFLIDDFPTVCALTRPYGWRCVNLATGTTFSSQSFHNRAHFNRWSLVLDDDAGDELTIASFDYTVMRSQ